MAADIVESKNYSKSIPRHHALYTLYVCNAAVHVKSCVLLLLLYFEKGFKLVCDRTNVIDSVNFDSIDVSYFDIRSSEHEIIINK